MVAEADESDRSFLKLSPTVAVVTNIDREHLDTYRDLADVQEAFVGFVNKVPFYGAAVLCLDDGPCRTSCPRVERRVVTYGLSPQAHVSARDVQLEPDAARRYTAVARRATRWARRAGRARRPQRAQLAGRGGGGPRPGRRRSTRSRRGLASFTGVDRRFQVRGEAGGVLVVDDYGHHPTEIRATLEALRTRAGARRTVVLFQPHRYTRTQAPLGRVLPRLPPGRRAAAHRHLRRRRGADRRASAPRRWRGPSPSAATGRSPTRATSRRAVERAGRRGARGRRGADAGRGQRVDAPARSCSRRRGA